MFYKRYGYKHPSMKNETSYSKYIEGRYLSILFGAIAAIMTGIGAFIAVGITAASLFFVAEFVAPEKNTEEFNAERHNLHVASAENHYKNGDYKAAVESYRKAEIYGELSNIERHHKDIATSAKNA